MVFPIYIGLRVLQNMQFRGKYFYLNKKKMKESEQNKILFPFKDGDIISCKIYDQTIPEARVLYEDNKIFLLQNFIYGFSPNNKHGYKYGWIIYNNNRMITRSISWEEFCQKRYITKVKILKKMKESKQNKILFPFKDGDIISCEINGQTIPEARVSYEGNKIFLLQNFICGHSPNNKHGYKYGWCIYNNEMTTNIIGWEEFCRKEYITKIKILNKMNPVAPCKVGDKVLLSPLGLSKEDKSIHGKVGEIIKKDNNITIDWGNGDIRYCYTDESLIVISSKKTPKIKVEKVKGINISYIPHISYIPNTLSILKKYFPRLSKREIEEL